MPTGIIESLTDPQVLISAGVPAILGLTSGSVATAAQTAALVASTVEASALAQLQTTADALTGYEWGLFPNTTQSNSLLDSVMSAFGLSQGSALFPEALILEVNASSTRVASNAPVENGSFTTYNKVAEPDRYELTMSISGTIRQKEAALKKLFSLEDSTTLVSIRMPEYTRSNMTVLGNPFNRNARMTADLIIVRVLLQEVRTYPKTTVTTTKAGTVAVTEDQGVLQTQSPTTSQQATISRSS